MSDDRFAPPGTECSERDYLTWKRRKIELALEEAKDRSRLIPIEQVRRELGIEL